MNIEHIVLGCGGCAGLTQLSIINNLVKEEIIKLDKIKSYYGTSVGSLICAIIILTSKNTDDAINYFIKRPWDKVFNLTTEKLTAAYINQGYFGKNFFYEILYPFLKVNNLNENITLKEFYDWSKKEFYIYGTNINGTCPSKIVFDYINYPDVELIDAIWGSCSYIIYFQPFYFDNNCIIDGGVMDAYPINDCLKKNNEDQILGIYIPTDSNEIKNITKENSFIDFINHTLCSFKWILFNQNFTISKYSIKIDNPNKIERWIKCISSQEERQKYIDEGNEIAEKFILSLNS